MLDSRQIMRPGFDLDQPSNVGRLDSASSRHADRPRHPAPPCGGAQLLHADHAAARHRAAGLRAGRPDPRPGARAGPDAAPPRRDYRAGDLERRYPRLADRGGLLRQLRLRAARHAHADASAHAAHARGRRRAGRRPKRCWTSCASAAWCTRARSTRISRTARRATGSAARPTPARNCSTACTTAACCAWRGAKAACACTRRARPCARAGRCRARRMDALVDVIVAKYAPLPAATLGQLVQPAVRGARAAVARRAAAALARAKERLPTAASTASLVLARRREPGLARAMRPTSGAPARALRPGGMGPPPLRAALGLGLPLRGLHAGAQARSGYYALPLLWRDQVIGWGNLACATAG